MTTSFSLIGCFLIGTEGRFGSVISISAILKIAFLKIIFLKSLLFKIT
jgi:hypothetical protein